MRRLRDLSAIPPGAPPVGVGFSRVGEPESSGGGCRRPPSSASGSTSTRRSCSGAGLRPRTRIAGGKSLRRRPGSLSGAKSMGPYLPGARGDPSGENRNTPLHKDGPERLLIGQKSAPPEITLHGWGQEVPPCRGPDGEGDLRAGGVGTSMPPLPEPWGRGGARVWQSRRRGKMCQRNAGHRRPASLWAVVAPSDDRHLPDAKENPSCRSAPGERGSLIPHLRRTGNRRFRSPRREVPGSPRS
jgi:hypothetical protein